MRRKSQWAALVTVARMFDAPYGSWTSPISIEMLTSASVRLGTPAVDGNDLYWTEARADQGGRVSLWRLAPHQARTELTPAPFYVRSRVHEYGGGEYAVRDGVVVVSSFDDGRVYLLSDDAPPRPLTPCGADLRYADLRVHPTRNLVLAVREDHSSHGEPVNTIVALDLNGPNHDGGRVLCQGADFYSTPELAPDGRLAWVEWNHPDMPWDATRLRVAKLTGSAPTEAGLAAEPDTVAGGDAESAVQPRWTPSGTLAFLSDRTGWWNFYTFSDRGIRSVHEAEAEFCEPQWTLGAQPYAVVDDDHLICTWSRNGASSTGLLTLSTGELKPIPAGSGTTALAANHHLAAAVVTFEDRPVALSKLELSNWTWTEVRRSSEIAVEKNLVSVARPVSWSGTDGPVYGWFYPPTNPDCTAPNGSLPPLITYSHGGPTSFSPATFDLDVQYWTSRGFAVLDVNYGGSAGYGRAYRQRLNGNWGIVDVEDCAHGARAMGEQGLADPDRLTIQGGSAGGYTTLRALTSTDVFAAGISLYGVGDLESLAQDTHKFESRYLDGLVGPYPEAAEIYRDRSPVHHVDNLNAPILLLQGSEDKVVPPNQAEAMAAAARSKGLPVALIVFPGEGHGFRRAENIRASIEAQLYFLGRVFGFTPADELPAIPIENLPT